MIMDPATGDGAILLMNGDWYADDTVYEMLGHVLRGQAP
jgi:hypothetical protein